MRAKKRSLKHLAAAVLAAHAALAAAQTEPQRIEIVGTSPLPGQGVPRDALPYNTQVVRRSAIDAAHTEHAGDHLARRAAGVQINDIQGSPFQGDLTFRGFRASGLLGAAQGLSVYIDGVRVNEPFGDVVNWDLIPEFAIDSMSLVPGANPAFGLNSLGGAISFTTANGRSAPGWRGEATLGSFERKRLSVSHGGAHGDWQHYLGLGLFDERGWRDFSDGRLGQVVGKLGHKSTLGEFSVNLLAGRSTLVGNGLTPLYTFDDAGARTPDIGQARREAVYTHPDQTSNRLGQISLQWRRDVGEQAVAEALVYARNTRRATVNGDGAEGDVIDPAENASFNRTATKQRASGAAAAWSLRSGAHRVQVGASVDAARVHFEQTEREGVFDETRGVQPIDGEEDELSARVAGRTQSLGVYATDTWQIAPATHLTGTLRVNQARVSNTLTTVDDDTGVVQERPRETFTYRSANPALGIAHRLQAGPTLFANVARNNRVPTVIELGCADPEEPCRLPAGLQSDPFLEQVVSTTVETGARYTSPQGWRGSLALFRTDNRNDILFRSVSATGQLGYFDNVPRTRHQGVDAEWSARWGALDIGLAYSFLSATYEATTTLRVGERNIAIEPGTRIAGLPRQMLKASVDWRLAADWTLGADWQALSRRGIAGNEDGLIEDDGDEEVDFSLPGYAVLNLRASWKPAALPGFEFFARISNATNRRFASFGALAETVFDAQGAYTGLESDAVFVAPGAPRALNVGLRWVY